MGNARGREARMADLDALPWPLQELATNQANDGTYNWTVAEVEVSDARIRVSATDLSGNTATDQSDEPFTIDSSPPTVVVTSPNGGEYWAGGSSQCITWTVNDANLGENPITIEYHNGVSWQTISTNEANDGSYSWTVPTDNCSSAKIRK